MHYGSFSFFRPFFSFHSSYQIFIFDKIRSFTFLDQIHQFRHCAIHFLIEFPFFNSILFIFLFSFYFNKSYVNPVINKIKQTNYNGTNQIGYY